MSVTILRISILISLGILLVVGAASAQDRWFRGNIHVHTINSDGASPPDEVVRWYREHGYHFVAITDHDLMTPVEGLNAVFAAPDRFLVLSGVEVSDRAIGKPVHVNGLGVAHSVQPQGGQTVAETIDHNLDAIEDAGGLAILAHPNGLLPRALEVGEIVGSRVTHFEVCCADFKGGSGHPSTDEIWDGVLTSGRRMYGVAVDDAHRFDSESRDPGSAWVMVRARELTTDALLDAIQSGDFYATTGVILESVTTIGGELCAAMAEGDQYGFRTFFIGDDGRTLSVDESLTPCYLLVQDDVYVRARIERSDGALAWLQPLFNMR
jgi:hypothetical protein